MVKHAPRHGSRSAGVSRQALSLLLGLSLGACGGGGGGGGAGGLIVDGADYQAEFEANWGLAAVEADAARDAGATGVGTVVAVIDTGVDLDHPELRDRLHPASADVVDYDSADDTDGHGTMVAGIVGAERNGLKTHGVAYDTSIMAIDAYDEDGPLGAGFYDSHVAAATNHARTSGADVINYSIGRDGALSASYEAAMAAAADAGIIMVYAAGNEGNAEPQWPARFAADPDAHGLGVIVGAVDSANAMPEWSNRASSYADYYMVAPGVSVTSTAVGGDTATGSGTSFAAPHVAGAAAVLKQYWPALTPAQIVDLLFSTATDLGDPGVDTVYGHGLLNLAEAVKPQGGASLPAGTDAGDGGTKLESTSMTLGAAFGDALETSALRQALFLDGYGRDYRTDLTQRLRRSSPQPDLAGWLEAGAASGGGRAALPSLALAERAVGQGTPGGTEAVRLSLGFGAGEMVLVRGSTLAGVTALAPSAGTAPLAREGAALSYLALAGEAEGSLVAYPLGGGWRVAVGIAGGRRDGAAGEPSAATLSYLAELRREWHSGASLAVGAGALREDGGLLGSSGDGGFRLESPVATRFLALAGRVPIGGGWSVLGRVAAGHTDAGGLDTGLMSDFSAITSATFAIGVAADSLVAPGRLTLTLSQPLRVMSGSALLDVPAALTLDGGVARVRERASLAPSGTERDLELGYRLPLAGGAVLEGAGLVQFQPGHDADAPPAYTLGIRYRLPF